MRAHLLPMFGELRPQATAGRRLSNTTLPADEDPLKCILLDDILEGGIGEILVVVVIGVHGCVVAEVVVVVVIVVAICTCCCSS